MTTPAPKPSTVSGWHPTDGSLIVDPGSTAKAAGFVAGDRPPASWFDWEWDLTSQWQEWLRDLLPYGVFNVGESRITGPDDTALPRIKYPVPAAATATRTAVYAPLLLDTLGLAGFIVYNHNPDDIGAAKEVVLNARWADSGGGVYKWIRRAGSGGSPKTAAILRFSYDGTLKVYIRTAGSAGDAWTDTYNGAGWDTRVFEISTAATHFVADLDVPNLVVNTISILTHITGNVTATGNVSAVDVNASGDSSTGGNSAVTGNQAVGGNATVTGTLGAGATTVTTMHATGAVTVDGNATLGNSTSDTVTIAGTVAANAGLYTSEHQAFLVSFDGSGGALFMPWSGMSGNAGLKLFRQKDGAAISLAMWISATTGSDLKLELYDGGSVIATITLTAGQGYQAAVISAGYTASDYLKLKLSVVGGGTLGAPIDVSGLVLLQE